MTKLKYLSFKRLPWRLSYRDFHTGALIEKGFKTEEDAKTFLANEEEQAKKERKLLSSPALRNDPNCSASVASVVSSYILSLDNPTTRKTTEGHLRPFLALFGKKAVNKVSADTLRKYVAILRSRGLADTTVRLRTLLVMTAFASAGLKIDFKLPSARSCEILPPSLEELHAIYAVAPQHIQRIVILGFYTGARIGPSELFKLRWKDIDLSAGILHMPQADKGARASTRIIPIQSRLFSFLQTWKAEDEGKASYVIHYKGKPVVNIGVAWRGAVKRAGIERRIRPYDLRHAFASMALENGADIKAVAQIMGHADSTMLLKVYQHIKLSSLKTAIETLGDIL